MFETLYLRSMSESVQINWLNNHLDSATSEDRISKLIRLATDLELINNGSPAPNADYAKGLKKFKEKAQAT